ncbi:MAG: tetratricopeptide repeat protein [Acidobacteria bacterium]|nr:tetratricopeptide repeat protein [Acidobacteriota bacterium]
MKLHGLAKFLPAAILMALLPWAVAQTQGNQGSGSGTGSGGTTTPTPKTPSVPSVVTTPSTELPRLQTIPETIYITGYVMQEDGSPPPFGTEIELDCGDTVTREATVHSDGHYGFQVGSNNRIGRVMPDASDQIEDDPFDMSTEGTVSSAYGALKSSTRTPLSIRLLRCEVRAQYPGYRSSSVRMIPGEIFGLTEVGPIIIYRIEKVQGTSVSATSLMAPKEVRKSIDRASKALKNSKFSEAEEILKESIEKYPQNAEAWFLLGQSYHLQARNEDAEENYLKAIDIDSFFVRPYITLARLALAKNGWDEAAELTDKALELDPVTFPEAYMLNALSYYYLDDMDTAERSARRGLRLDFGNQYPQMHLILSNVMARRNDEPGSIQEMRLYLKAAPDAEDAALVRSRVQEKEKQLKASTK